jgi:hypothetical protein
VFSEKTSKHASYKFLFSSFDKVIEYLENRKKITTCDQYEEPLVCQLLDYIKNNKVTDIEENFDHIPAIFKNDEKVMIGICKQQVDRHEEI